MIRLNHQPHAHRAERPRRPAYMLFATAVAMTFVLVPAATTAKPTPQPSPSTTVATAYGGRAYGLSVAATALLDLIKLGPIVLSDTGELPSTGGEKTAQAASIHVPLSAVDVRADVLSTITVGSGLGTDSDAETVGVSAVVDNILTLDADLIQAQATATCTSATAPPTYAGKVHLVKVDLEALGIPVKVAVNPAPNTTIDVGGGVAKVILNEQYVANGRLNVNAIHIVVGAPYNLLSKLASADVVISHAEAGATCGSSGGGGGGGGGCPVKDFMTGGGTLTSSTGAKVSFGFNGGLKNPGLMGHFNAIDHGNGAHLQGTSVTDYTITGTTSRRITYDNGALVVNAADNGEPGTSDTISFASYNGNPIATGNIQLHKPAGCDTTTSGGPKHH